MLYTLSHLQLLTSRVYGKRSADSASSSSGRAAAPPGHALHRQAYRSLSMCIAAICESCPAQILPSVQRFIADVKVYRIVICIVYDIHVCIIIRFLCIIIF